jgi:hypothetical protein
MIINNLNELKGFLLTETDNIKICNKEYNDGVSFVFKTMYSFSYTGLSRICMSYELDIKKHKTEQYTHVENMIHRGILLNKFYCLGEDYGNRIEVHSRDSWSVSTILSNKERSIKEIQEDDLMSQKGKDAKIEKIDKYYSIATEIATYVESDEFKEIFDKEMAEVKIEKLLYVNDNRDEDFGGRNCNSCV